MTDRFSEALVYAHEAHRSQFRKSTTIPYISHLMSVASLVLENGGDEDEAIAALLHDTAEDQGGAQRLDDIRTRFGGRVAKIVEACSDSLETPKPPWRKRKERYLAHLRTADSSVLRVSSADKLHNIRSILSDWKQIGDQVWKRFHAGKDDQLWYYTELLKTFQAGDAEPSLVEELSLCVTILRQIIESDERT
ncbi:MAG TPA: HD domain-containing protein [Candidatus Binataceae bacterium]|nr:HD domain-containing protein [Candidatus Binataceae bacterium]